MIDELNAALESLGKTLKSTREREGRLLNSWYCENCGAQIGVGLRCRMCGKAEEDIK